MKAALIALVVVLAGCGWQLRGNLLPPLEIDHLRIVSSQEHTELLQGLHSALARQDIAVVAPPEKAPYTLVLGDESLNKRTVGVGSDNLAAAFELTLSQDYQLLGKDDRPLAAMTRAQVTRSYDASDPTGLEREQELLLEEMRADLVQQIMRRIYFLLRDNKGQPAS